ncbi:hypothetical protein ACVWZ3_005919 [Bradyrhizobium sp. i1.3.6]
METNAEMQALFGIWLSTEYATNIAKMIDAMPAKYGQRSLLIEHSAGRVAYTHILNLAPLADALCERVHIVSACGFQG